MAASITKEAALEATKFLTRYANTHLLDLWMVTKSCFSCMERFF